MTPVSRVGLVPLLAVLMLTACTLERPVSDVPTSYDFGPPPAHARSNPAIRGVVLVASVRAGTPIDESGIVYRLLYEDSARPQVYATSRWAGDPADLLTERVRSRFAALAEGVVTPAFSARSDYTLRLELSDFSQHFDAPGQSRAVLRARATLLESESRKVLAQRAFDVERPAQPNAAGAVKALTEAADTFVEEVAKWSVANAKK